MSIISYPNLVFSVNNIPRLTCMTCGDTMKLILIEPLPNATNCFDIRTFSCKDCEVVESFVVDISKR